MKNKPKHGSYWVIKEGQEGLKRGLYLGYGKTEPDKNFKFPLKTIESTKPFGMSDERFESVRYFEWA